MTVLAIGFRLECRPGRTVYELATTGMAGCFDVRDDFAGYGVDVWFFGRDGFCPAEDGGETISGSGYADGIFSPDLEALGEVLVGFDVDVSTK